MVVSDNQFFTKRFLVQFLEATADTSLRFPDWFETIRIFGTSGCGRFARKQWASFQMTAPNVCTLQLLFVHVIALSIPVVAVLSL
jgi:hypothetical protein